MITALVNYLALTSGRRRSELSTITTRAPSSTETQQAKHSPRCMNAPKEALDLALRLMGLTGQLSNLPAPLKELMAAQPCARCDFGVSIARVAGATYAPRRNWDFRI